MNNMLNMLRSPAAENYRRKAVRKVSGFAFGLMRALILVGISYIILSPVFGIISNSVKDIRDVYNPLVYLIPDTFTPANLQKAFGYMNYPMTLARTLVYTLAVTGIQLMISSMVGYGFARFKFPGNNILFGMVIVTIVVPIQTYMVPLYMQMRYFGLFGLFEFNFISNYWSIFLLNITGMGLRSGLYIYIFRQFFKGLPKEIEEAALIDGAGQLRTYLTVMLPNATPAIITVVMFSIVWQYNDTFYAGLFIPAVELLCTRLTGLGMVYTMAETIRDPNLVQLVVNAGIILVIVPIITIYLALQRFFMEGLERSGIVG